MKEESNSFLEGSVTFSLMKFAAPVLAAMVLQALYGAVDLWAVGRFATAADISAVSTGSQTMQIIIGAVTGLSMGTTVLLGQRIGSGDDDGAAETVGNSIIVFAVLAIVLSIVMFAAAPGIACADEGTGRSVFTDDRLYTHMRWREPLHRGIQPAERCLQRNGRFAVTADIRDDRVHCEYSR